jgi:hypothetical protein
MDVGGTGAGTVVVNQNGGTMAITVVGNITVRAGSTYQPPTGIFTISGNITNAGTFTLNAASSVVFDGNTTLSGANLVTFANGFTVNAGKTFANSQNGNIVASGKTATINGTFQVNQGSWTGSTGTYVYGAAGTLVFNNTSGAYGPIDNSHLYWPATNSPFNVTVAGAGGITMGVARTVNGTFQTAAAVNGASNLTLNGIGKINLGGFFSATPNWGPASTLIYNTGTVYGRNNEFANTGSVPANILISGNTTLDYPNGGALNAARTITGDLTIDAGSALYMDYGGFAVGQLSVNNLVLNGSLSLGAQAGGDLVVRGNWTRTGTFTPNSRAVFLSGASGNQTITGTTTFDYLIVDKAAGSVVLAGTSDIIVNQVLTLTNGIINTGNNNVITTNSAPNTIVRTNGWVFGSLRRAIASGVSTRNFPVGDATNYTPVSLDFAAGTGAGSLTVSTSVPNAAPAPGNPPSGSGISQTKYINRLWTISNSTLTTPSYSATFTYINPTDVVGGANTNALVVAINNGGVWSKPGVTSSVAPTVTTVAGLTDFGTFYLGETGCTPPSGLTYGTNPAIYCANVAITTNSPLFTGDAAISYSVTPALPAGLSLNLTTGEITGTPTTASAAANYLVTVTNACGFTSVNVNIAINDGPSITLSSAAGTDAQSICTGSGAIIPITYTIGNGGTGASITSGALPTGVTGSYSAGVFTIQGTPTSPGSFNYTITTAGGNGCPQNTASGSITVKASPTATFTKTMASACGGGSDGTITVTASGGVGPYGYSWTGPGGYTASTAAITGLGSGDYTIVISDVQVCTKTIPNITIWQAAPPALTNSGSSSGACGNTGSIILYGSNGVAPYTYSLDNVTYVAGNTFTGLAPGTYTGYVKDFGGCVTSKPNITVGSVAAMNVTAYTRGASACANDGSIQLFRTGGVNPYTYSLDNVTYQGSNLFTGLVGGTYTGYVKDAQGCVAPLPGITVAQAPPVAVTESHTNSSSCTNDGTFQLRPSGGQPGYTYSLNNIAYQAGSSFTGLAAGSYTGWVKDAKGCTASVPVTIGTAPAVTVTAYARPASSCASTNGSIQLFRTGGYGPYTYSLDNITFQLSNMFSNQAPGTYTGYVKDSRNCIGTLPGIFVGPNCGPRTATNNTQKGSVAIAVNDGLNIQAFPNPTTSEFTLMLSGYTNDKVLISVTDIAGREVYRTEGTGRQQYKFGTNLKQGMYLVQVLQGGKKQSVKVVKE